MRMACVPPRLTVRAVRVARLRLRLAVLVLPRVAAPTTVRVLVRRMVTVVGMPVVLHTRPLAHVPVSHMVVQLRLLNGALGMGGLVVNRPAIAAMALSIRAKNVTTVTAVITTLVRTHADRMCVVTRT